MLAPGKYKARALPNTIEFGVASTGTEQVKMTFMLSDTGQSITWIGNFASDKAEKRVLDAYRAAGWQSDTLTDTTGIGEVECEIVIAHKPNQDGELRAEVEWVNPLGGGGGFSFKTQMDQGSVEALAERLRGRAMLLREKSGGAQSSPASTARAPAGRAPANRGDAWDGQGADPEGLPDF